MDYKEKDLFTDLREYGCTENEADFLTKFIKQLVESRKEMNKK